MRRGGLTRGVRPSRVRGRPGEIEFPPRRVATTLPLLLLPLLDRRPSRLSPSPFSRHLPPCPPRPRQAPFLPLPLRRLVLPLPFRRLVLPLPFPLPALFTAFPRAALLLPPFPHRPLLLPPFLRRPLLLPPFPRRPLLLPPFPRRPLQMPRGKKRRWRKWLTGRAPGHIPGRWAPRHYRFQALLPSCFFIDSPPALHLCVPCSTFSGRLAVISRLHRPRSPCRPAASAATSS